MKSQLTIFTILAALILVSCKHNGPKTVVAEHPYSDSIHERLASAVIYEVNIRQITTEGTFKAFTEQHIDRLKKLGVDVLWLMPVYPISVKNRKGTLGSYYSIADYKAVNPEFGTLDDFKQLVNKAHEAGMLVILDWVANHTGWDNKWITEHPEWYTHDKKGNIIPPVADWTDVADLNYDNPGLNKAMADAMEYWVREAGIDGYRCDAAVMAPTEFWHKALGSLDSIRPVIKLAEAWEPELLAKGFDAGYNWEFHHLMNAIAGGRKDLIDISRYMALYDSLYAPDDMLLNFITNHDENSWAGTEYERMGMNVPIFAIFTYLMPGIPLIYTGQEAAMNKRLRFFEKDTIIWNDTTLYSFYRKLNKLKHDNPALRAGINAGIIKFHTDSATNFTALLRTSGDNKVLGLFNLSDACINQPVPITEAYATYRDIFTSKKLKITKNSVITLEPWHFMVLEKR